MSPGVFSLHHVNVLIQNIINNDHNSSSGRGELTKLPLLCCFELIVVCLPNNQHGAEPIKKKNNQIGKHTHSIAHSLILTTQFLMVEKRRLLRLTDD